MDTLNLNLCFYGSDQISKVMVSDHIVVLLTKGKMNSKNANIFTRGPPHGAGSCSTMEWAPPENCFVADIALFQGKLYVLTVENDESRRSPELHVLDVSDEQSGVRSVQCIRSTPRDPCSTASYKSASSSTWSGPEIGCCWWNGRSTWIPSILCPHGFGSKCLKQRT